MSQAQKYPAPRYPDFVPHEITQQDLLEAARVVVKRPGGVRGVPGYSIKSGERALMVVTPVDDQRVVDAVAQAIREAGATVDIFVADLSDFIGPRLENKAWGYLENPIFRTMRVSGRELSRLLGGGQFVEKTLALASFNHYDILISSYDGYLDKPRLASFRWEDMVGPSVDELYVTAHHAELPRVVVDKIEEKVFALLKQTRRVRVTDPEGTDVRWNLPASVAKIQKFSPVWREFLCMPDHLGGANKQSADTHKAVDFTGVIAGTTNHVGAFPHIKVFVRGGNIEKIEGGGRFGDEWRKLLDEYRSTSWPNNPGPGFGWIQECAIGLEPSRFRVRDSMKIPFGPLYEHQRDGIYHWAFGVMSLRVQSPEARQYIIDHNLPDGHLDVHNRFATMILQTEDGKEVVFIDKGRITVLDDPEVRQVAAQFGDPDVLLRDAWIPPTPGINVPGDYMRDYANDPVSWIVNEYDRFFAKSQKQRTLARPATSGAGDRKAGAGQ